jgi:dolichol-phosphate mannosyltransferase
VSASLPQLSIVVPVFDEGANIDNLTAEISSVFRPEWGETGFEIIMVDDCSRDDTPQRLSRLQSQFPELVALRHEKNSGQSRALRSGILAARAPLILTLDGDGQNPPHEGIALVKALASGPPSLGLVGGERQKRQDTLAKKLASQWANHIRQFLLKDGCKDTGCGLKAFRREAFLSLAYFDHIHRYLPAMMVREGYECAYLPVSHRARTIGVSKYTNLGRLLVAITDVLGVIWLRSRSRLPGRVDKV